MRAENRDRNVGIVLGCLAEKMAGPRAMTIFTNDVFNYLVDNLVSDRLHSNDVWETPSNTYPT